MTLGAIDDEAELELRGYRPHLDGLRTVAVYLVLLFHAGLVRFEGGFIGVDVFFVLSGFLVTRILITTRAAGTFTLRTFYARRARRLLPAAVIAVIGIAWLWAIVASPAETLSIKDGFTPALLYFANWFFIAESSDYFAANLDASPVLHFWSLSIEEQFYLVWPLALLALLKLTSRFPRRDLLLRGIVATLAVASLAWALKLAQGDLNRAYYGTDARAYQLLSGALLALSAGFFQRFRSRAALASAVSVAALVVLVLASTSLVDADPVWRGVIATALTLTLLVAFEVGGGPAKRVLSFAPMTYLGQISYGTYLWHWPVMLVARQRLGLSPLSTFVLAGIVATGIAALSSRLLEHPIRDSLPLGKVPRAVVASSLALSVVAALVVVPYLVDPDRTRSTNTALVAVESPDTPGTSDTPDNAGTPDSPDSASGARVDATTIDWQAAAEDKAGPTRCTAEDVSKCTVVEGSGKHVLLVGDSHAISMIPLFVKLAEDNDFTLSLGVEWGCAWPENLHYNHVSDDRNDECDATRAHWYETLVPQLEPDVIVTTIRAPDDVGRPVPVAGAGDAPEDIGAKVSELAAATIEHLTSEGRSIVLLEPLPVTVGANDPLKCLSGATFVDECSFEASPLSVLEASYREWASTDPNIYSIDYDVLACPALPRCDAVVDGIVVRWDDTHLTKSFAISIADRAGSLLEEPLALETER